MIRLEGISRTYGRIKAVDDLSLRIRRSKITIIAGADGSGKSTLFRIMLGLAKADSGEIYIGGEKLGGDFSKMTSISGYMPERFSLYPDLTVEENMDFFADINRVPLKRKEELKNRLLEKTGMIRFRKRRAGALSGGMKQKLSLSTILLSSPEVIILDEPTTGVDPLSRIEFFRIIESLKEEGRTIVISTPYLDEAEKGDYVVFLKNGRIIREGDIDSLKKNAPFGLWRVLPKGNIFDAISKLENSGEDKGNYYIKGKYINCITGKSGGPPAGIDSDDITEQIPGLEDIYMYYEAAGMNGGGDHGK